MNKNVNVNINADMLDILKHLNVQRKEDILKDRNKGTRSCIYLVQTQEMVLDYTNSNDVVLLLNGEDIITKNDIGKGVLDNDIDDYLTPEDALIVKASIKEKHFDISDIADLMLEYGFSDFYETIDIVSYKMEWKTVATFITRQEAEDYMDYQSHNLSGESRVYVTHSGYGNKGSLNKLLELLDTIDIFGGEK